MDYNKILEDLEDFAKKEYIKFCDEYQLTFLEGANISIKSPFLKQELSEINCTFTFNYNHFSIVLWNGDSGGWGLMYNGAIYANPNEALIKEIMGSKKKPFKIRTKTVKFSY